MDIETDVAIIGGGAVGLSVAYVLQQRGRTVTVLERGEFEAGCSTGNAGLIVPSHVIPLAAPGVIQQGLRWLLRRDSPFRIKPRLDVGLLRWLWRFYWACSEEHVERSIPLLRDLNLESRAIYEQWLGAQNFGFRSTGLLMLHETETGKKKGEKEAERAREAGLEVSRLDSEELKEVSAHLPGSVQGGVYYHQDALLDPLQLIGSLRQTLAPEDVSLRGGVEVTGFERKNGAVQFIRTTNGRVRANDIVIAAGTWSAALGEQVGVNVPVEPGKGYSVTFNVPEERPSVPFILTEKKVSVTPLGDRMRFAGTLELSGFDRSVDWHRVQPILDTAERYVDDASGLSEVEDVWVGFRPCSPDGLPIIGRVPGIDNLALATGHSMMGISLAPITAELIADILEGQRPRIDVSLLRSDRFQ